MIGKILGRAVCASLFLHPEAILSYNGERGGVSVEHYLILARSVTYAQRMQRALERTGIRCRIRHAPGGLTDLGCAYVVQVETRELPLALTVIHREGLGPVQVFLEQRGVYREVRP